jgi:hypothetical protein
MGRSQYSSILLLLFYKNIKKENHVLKTSINFSINKIDLTKKKLLLSLSFGFY